MNNLKYKLKRCQPYFIEKELIPNLYFKEDEKELQYWIFFYSFIRKLSDEAISIRLGTYGRNSVNKKLLYIIHTNEYLITDFISKHYQK